MAKNLSVQFANFTLRFGEKVLADLLKEIVIPAFLNEQEIRSGKGSLKLHKVRVLSFPMGSTERIVVAGRLLKITTLQRQKVYDQATDQLIDDPAEMESTPTSFFVLLLDTHKLMYVEEEPGSPPIASFKTHIGKLIRRSRTQYIQQNYDQIEKLRDEEEQKTGVRPARTTKRALNDRTPEPELNIIEIGTEGSFADFIGGLAKIKKATMRLVRTNDEVSDDEFFQQLRLKQIQAKATTTTVIQSNPDGLDKEQVQSQFAPALDGNATIQIRGFDEHQNEMKGSNERFALKVGIGRAALGDDVDQEAKGLMAIYDRLVADKRLPDAMPSGSRLLQIIAAARSFVRNAL